MEASILAAESGELTARKFNIAQTSAEKFAEISTGLGMAQLASSEHGAEMAAKQATIAAGLKANGGK